MARLTPASQYLISEFDKNIAQNNDQKISVDPVVSEVATWYEKLRNAMDIREDDVILRAAIERILKRRLLLGGMGGTIAQPLVRELAWARYFPNQSMSESIVSDIQKTINLYFKLQDEINKKHRVNRNMVSEWILHLLSSEINFILNPNKEKELMVSFMFQSFKDNLQITDDTPQTKDAQIYIAIRRAFAKEDLPLLRYQLFLQLFDHLTEEKIDKVSGGFIEAKKIIEHQLKYPLKDRIYTYVKKQTIPFFILEDILRKNKGSNHKVFGNDENLKMAVFEACSLRYKNIRSKVQTAIIRGVIFILITKAIFALALESNFENFFYGKVYWNSILLNITLPPLLMVIVGLLIQTPGKENSQKILGKINNIIYKEQPPITQPVFLKKTAPRVSPILNSIFIVLWILAFILSFGAVILVLSKLHFNLVSQGIFIFFLTIVSFISYRINQTAHMYTISDDKQNLKSVLFDFFFIPFIDLGRHLTENISKINLLIFVFDLIIETPFKVIFSFFEEWFLYLRTQREKLG